jgi:hypothetical protein
MSKDRWEANEQGSLGGQRIEYRYNNVAEGKSTKQRSHCCHYDERRMHGMIEDSLTMFENSYT